MATVKSQADRAGIAMPEVGIFDHPSPNAFAKEAADGFDKVKRAGSETTSSLKSGFTGVSATFKNAALSLTKSGLVAALGAVSAALAGSGVAFASFETQVRNLNTITKLSEGDLLIYAEQIRTIGRLCWLHRSLRERSAHRSLAQSGLRRKRRCGPGGRAPCWSTQGLRRGCDRSSQVLRFSVHNRRKRYCHLPGAGRLFRKNHRSGRRRWHPSRAQPRKHGRIQRRRWPHKSLHGT